KPDKKKAEEIFLREEKNLSDILKERYGEDAIQNYRPSEWFKTCNLVDVEISEEKFKELLNND
ncbi:hypothetical protein ACJ5HV_13245, partial [Staphylococcus aureus]